MPVKNNGDLTRSYVWDIADFASLATLDDSDILLENPVFNKRSIDEKWKFHIYLNGSSNEDYIGFYLSKLNISSQAVYNFILSIGKPNSEPIKSYKYIGKRFVGPAIGERRFLCKKSNGWILKGPVRFRCDITKIDPRNYDLTCASSFNSSVHFEDTANLSTDLEKLLRTPFHSDLTVNMTENVIQIHKCMLYAARQEVLPSIGISDRSFELLIHYIYTGKIRDSQIPFELLRYAERLGLSSLIQCAHEHTCSYHIYSEGDVEEKVISYNLDELELSEEVSTCVHILRTTLYTKKLAIQVNISDHCENEKFIDISLRFFGVFEYRPIILISKISLTSEAGTETLKEEKHVFLKDELWNFPRLQWPKDKEYWCNLGMQLTVELTMSEWSNLRMVKGIKTKTKLHTRFQTITDNLPNLRSSMAWLWQMRHRTGNLVLLSDDNKFFRVHDCILWARWPGAKKLFDKNSDPSDKEDIPLELKLPSDVLNILLPYLYTGFMPNFDQAKAKMLLKYSSDLEFPDYLVKKCESLLSVNHESYLF